MSTASTPVDRGPLLDLTGGDTAFADELLRDFATERRAEGERLRELLVSGAPPADIFPLAHRLKGSGNMIGANQLSEVCLEIELAARDSDSDLQRFIEPFDIAWKALFEWLAAEGLLRE